MHQRSNVVDEVFFALCKSVDTGLSLGAWLRYKYDKSQLVTMELDPSWYNTAYAFHKDFSVISYLAKAEFLKTGIDTVGVAIQRFRTAESTCKDTNRRLRTGAGITPAQNALIWRIQRKVADILGPLNVTSMMELCKWGPGATADIRREATGVDVKMTQNLSTTGGAYPYGKAWLESDPIWFESITGHQVGGKYSVLPTLFSFTEQNRVVVVPKNAKSGRTIAAEPTWNSFIQQGVGRYIRRRLLRFGVQLNNQQLNQELAEYALLLELCTIDLSMASDTVAREAVFLLLPLEWYLFLDGLRSKEYSDPVDGTPQKYEKFSSMGNAFTFELESTIFAAAVVACYEEYSGSHRSSMPHSCSVYGDDIICPSVIATRLIDILGVLGFTTNVAKTHLDGQYRESCGKHYFGGFDVTPAYQKKQLSGVHEIVRGGNRLFRLAYRMGGPYILDRTIYGAYAAMRRHAGKSSDCWIPFSERDDGWLAAADQRPGDKHHPDRGWHCKTLRNKRRFRAAAVMGVYAHRLYQISHAGRHDYGIGVIPEAAAGLRKELNRDFALKSLEIPDVSTSKSDRIELDPGGLRISRRWVKSSVVDFEATWN